MGPMRLKMLRVHRWAEQIGCTDGARRQRARTFAAADVLAATQRVMALTTEDVNDEHGAAVRDWTDDTSRQRTRWA